MGDKLKNYCLKCGEELVDKPMGQCPSCDSPYDLGFNITYTIFPRPPSLEAAIVSLIWSFVFSFIYTSIAMGITLVLPDKLAAAFGLIGGGILLLIIWMTSLRISRITSLFTLTYGFCWGPMLVVALAGAYGDPFMRDIDNLIILKMYFSFPAMLFVFLLPLWVTRQLLVWRWRAKTLASIRLNSDNISST